MWLYIPDASTSSASAPEASDLITPSSWQFQALERSAWSRGKPSRSRNWFALWKRAVWLQRLFGAMPEPSTADHGAALWMASLAASRASLTVLPASSSAKKTSETSGRQPAASSSSRARGSSSSRTSVGCCLRAVRSVSGETFTDWASRLREDCSRRQKSARRMSANASSSSQWPTPQVADINQDRGGMEHAQMKFDKSGYPNLANTAKVFSASAWPTPTANDWKGSGPTLERKDGQMRGDRLDYATEQLWTTPSAGDGQRGGTITENMSGTSLTQQVNTLWMTPRSHEVGQYQYSKGDKTKPVPTLTGQSLQWSTPSVADVQGGRKSRSGERNSELLMNGQADELCSLLDLTTSTVGETHSRPRRSLNPLFVEWLMGWPPGWTLAAWTDFACSGTELSLWKARMRSALSQLGLPQEAPPQQLALFG